MLLYRERGGGEIQHWLYHQRIYISSMKIRLEAEQVLMSPVSPKKEQPSFKMVAPFRLNVESSCKGCSVAHQMGQHFSG